MRWHLAPEATSANGSTLHTGAFIGCISHSPCFLQLRARAKSMLLMPQSIGNYSAVSVASEVRPRCQSSCCCCSQRCWQYPLHSRISHPHLRSFSLLSSLLAPPTDIFIPSVPANTSSIDSHTFHQLSRELVPLARCGQPAAVRLAALIHYPASSTQISCC